MPQFVLRQFHRHVVAKGKPRCRGGRGFYQATTAAVYGNDSVGTPKIDGPFPAYRASPLENGIVLLFCPHRDHALGHIGRPQIPLHPINL